MHKRGRDVSAATLNLPTGWQQLDPPVGLVLLAHAPVTGTFTSNLTATAEPNGDLGFRDWQVGVDMAFTQVLPGYTPIDLEQLIIEGRRGGRRLAVYDGPEGVPLAMEQWFVDIDGIGHTLTATLHVSEYAQWADALAATVTSWKPSEAS